MTSRGRTNRKTRAAGLTAVALLAFLAFGSGAPADAQALVRAAGPAIDVDTSQGVLITLPRAADTVFVANPAIADVQAKSPRLIYLYGKEPGETSLYAVDADQQVMLSRRVVVARDIARLQSALEALHPGGAVRVSAVDKAVILSGTVANPVAAEEVKRLADSFVGGDDNQLVNRVTVDEPNQVNLRVRVTEVDRTVIKELGINWEAVQHSGNFVFGVATGNPVVGLSQTSGSLTPAAPSLTGGGANSNAAFFTRNTGIGGTTTDSIVLGVNAGGALINSVIDALEQNGLVNILAEPNLTAMSGETASFLAGGEFPIIVPGGSLGQTTVIFKQYGVSLAFTPVVLANGRVSLRVKPEVSQLSNQGAVEISGVNIPALTTRRAETTVELGSGQSFAIGGLLQNNITDTINSLPGLGDLPVLGPLFRSTQFQRNESELVILVTPYLVRPVSNQGLSSPADGYTPPNDLDIYAGIRTAEPGAAPAALTTGTATMGGAGPIGPAGFIVN
jgi:pilus assembly protein CpaC